MQTPSSFDDLATPDDSEEEIFVAAKRYKEIEDQIDDLKLLSKEYKEIILSNITVHPNHQYEFSNDDLSVEVKIGSKLSWDEEKLKEIIGQVNDDKLPVFAQRKLTIKRSAFEAQPSEVQSKYLDALTTSAGQVTIKVETKNS